jgi:hypothetical protein
VDHIEAAMQALGSTFVADLAQTGSLQASLRNGGLHSQTYDAAGNPAHIFRSYRFGEHQAALLNLQSAVKSGEGIEDVLTVEASGTPSGDYAVSYSTDLSSLPARVDFDSRHRHPDRPRFHMDDPNREWLVDVGDAVLVDKVAAIPNPLAIRSAHLRQVDQVHLRDLADLVHLRSIRVLDRRQKTQVVD